MGFPRKPKGTEVHMYKSNVCMCAFAICCRITDETCQLFTRCVQSLNRGCHASGSSRVDCFAHCQHIRLRLFSEEPDKRWTGSHSEQSKKIAYSDATDRLCTYNQSPIYFEPSTSQGRFISRICTRWYSDSTIPRTLPRLR